MCSSTVAAKELQMQRLNQAEPGQPTVSKSDRRVRVADGRVAEAQNVVEQPITSGLLAGKSMAMHLIDKAGNDTCPPPSIIDLRRLRMVVDYEEGAVRFKDKPDIWHEHPTTKQGLMMIPLTKEARGRYNKTMPPPQPSRGPGLASGSRNRETNKEASIWHY